MSRFKNIMKQVLRNPKQWMDVKSCAHRGECKNNGERRNYLVYVDASSKRLGACSVHYSEDKKITPTFVSLPMPARLKGTSIEEKEAYITMEVLRKIPECSNVVIIGDNSSACTGFQKGFSNNPKINKLIHKSILLERSKDLVVQYAYITTKNNPADFPSRAERRQWRNKLEYISPRWEPLWEHEGPP